MKEVDVQILLRKYPGLLVFFVWLLGALLLIVNFLLYLLGLVEKLYSPKSDIVSLFIIWPIICGLMVIAGALLLHLGLVVFFPGLMRNKSFFDWFL
jgi:hypothetical protein